MRDKHPDFIYESEKELLYEKSKESSSNSANHTETEGTEKSFPVQTVLRTKESIGAAITVAMVAVAVGFACCENLVYIFLYNGSSATNGSFIAIKNFIVLNNSLVFYLMHFLI